MRRRDLKSVVLVELFGSIIESVEQHGADSGVMRHGYRPVDCVLQQGRTQLDALGAMIDCESPSTITGTGSGILRRTELVAIGCETAPAAKA